MLGSPERWVQMLIYKWTQQIPSWALMQKRSALLVDGGCSVERNIADELVSKNQMLLNF